MKQFLPIITLLFICTCVNKNVAAQDSAAVKAEVDSTEEDWDRIWVYMPQEGEFKGGDSALKKFFEQHLVYPQKAKRKKLDGTVTVQFILDKLGCVTNVEAISGPLKLRQSVIRAIKKSPKWDPAIQGGRQVRAFKQYDIIFKLDSVSIKKA